MAGKWNEKTYAIAVLRRASYRIPARTIALGKARVARGVYVCAGCKRQFERKDIQVDHIKPIVPTTGWDSFDGYITRLFCAPEGLQVLCRDECHKAKTKAENALRKRNGKKA